jgi:hypothetical protein
LSSPNPSKLLSIYWQKCDIHNSEKGIGKFKIPDAFHLVLKSLFI